MGETGEVALGMLNVELSDSEEVTRLKGSAIRFLR